MTRFTDKVVWITGASSGIGEALAYAFHAAGAHVVLSSRRESELARVAAACSGPGETMVVPLDLADTDALGDRYAAVAARFGRVDVLINNAGITHRALTVQTGMPVYRRLFDINLFGPLALTKHVLPRMIERGAGHIVVVSSITAHYGSPLRSGYSAAKHALHGMFESLRAELWQHGIPVTVAVLGGVRTAISASALTGDGTPYGRINRIQATGLAPEFCARRILDAVARRREEVTIASLPHRFLVWRARFTPRLLARAMRLKPRRG